MKNTIKFLFVFFNIIFIVFFWKIFLIKIFFLPPPHHPSHPPPPHTPPPPPKQNTKNKKDLQNYTIWYLYKLYKIIPTYGEELYISPFLDKNHQPFMRQNGTNP
uniref:Uncharacterized protein n=1 Tax=Cacopsylla melanoneura TaxID=428564 RepID=A0A8D9AYU8_9HEMI